MDVGTGLLSFTVSFAVAWGNPPADRQRLRWRDLRVLLVALAAYMIGAVVIAHFALPFPLGQYYGVGAGALIGTLGGYGARSLAGPPRRGRVRVTKRR